MAGLIRAERRNATKRVTVTVDDSEFDIWYRPGVFTPQFSRDLNAQQRDYQQQHARLEAAVTNANGNAAEADAAAEALADFETQVSPGAKLMARLVSQWDVFDYEYDANGEPVPNGNGESLRVRVPVTAEAIHEFDIYVQAAIQNAVVKDLTPDPPSANGSLA